MHAFAKATLAAVYQRAPAAIGRLTGLAYAQKNAELRSRVVEITKSSYEFGAEWLRAFDPAELPNAAGESRAGASCPDRGLGDAAHPHTGVVSRGGVVRGVRRLGAAPKAFSSVSELRGAGKSLD